MTARALKGTAASTFFALTGTAAAGLTGLLFVAFSLRVQDLQRSQSGLCFGRIGGSDLRCRPIWPGGGSAWWRPGC
jgi:hypothetical protein